MCLTSQEKLFAVPDLPLLLVVLTVCGSCLVCSAKSVVPRSQPAGIARFLARRSGQKMAVLLLLTVTAFTCAERSLIALLLKWLASTVFKIFS